ncbi:TatD family hydrolase [Paludibacterium yongneupense]|uniref:TatD family hydrolase n=1 Tax=Paludibacterium yongneupense TaxID=400061 RepID=UPI0006873C92|nr:TatD family hydrolase [Paludibacterium yongneupense]
MKTAAFAHCPPTPTLVDTHCHLDAPEFDADRDEVVAEAQALGLGQILVPAVDVSRFESVLEQRRRYGCWIAFGLHPLYLSSHLDDHLAVLEQALTRHAPVALGEIGLDFHVTGLDPARQQALFIEQLKLARRYDLPVLLHVRRAQDKVLRFLREQRIERGIAHAFNGSEQQARAYIRQGMLLGFGGSMTYDGSLRIRRLAASLPLDSIVLETDAPDIRPAWAQQTPNRPAQLARYAQLLAALRGVSHDIVTKTVFNNIINTLKFSGIL